MQLQLSYLKKRRSSGRKTNYRGLLVRPLSVGLHVPCRVNFTYQGSPSIDHPCPSQALIFFLPIWQLFHQRTNVISQWIWSTWVRGCRGNVLWSCRLEVGKALFVGSICIQIIESKIGSTCLGSRPSPVGSQCQLSAVSITLERM